MGGPLPLSFDEVCLLEDLIEMRFLGGVCCPNEVLPLVSLYLKVEKHLERFR